MGLSGLHEADPELLIHSIFLVGNTKLSSKDSYSA